MHDSHKLFSNVRNSTLKIQCVSATQYLWTSDIDTPTQCTCSDHPTKQTFLTLQIPEEYRGRPQHSR